jgi:hypothetical protein
LEVLSRSSAADITSADRAAGARSGGQRQRRPQENVAMNILTILFTLLSAIFIGVYNLGGGPLI